MKRLQRDKYYKMKDKLVPIAYSVTSRGNICVYYKGKYYHYLNDFEKMTFNPEGLEKRN